METRLPAPCVLVLIGPSGAGKTTWARAHFPDNHVVSSDALRAIVGIDGDDQRAGTAAFALLEQIFDERLSRRLTTVIDTLGLDDDRRADWVRRAHHAGVPIFAVLFGTEPSVAEQRNHARPRPLPKSVLAKQMSRFRQVSAGIADEGFDGVINQGAVAVVPPQIAEATQDPPVRERTTGHTFGLLVSRFNWNSAPERLGTDLASIAKRAENAGFRDLWVMDHMRQIPSVGRSWEDIPESYTTLSFLAGVTDSIRLGALVSCVTYRNPAHLGKIVATLDVLSGGRANCGIGLGWDRAEHGGYGWEMPSTPDRYVLLEETLQMLPLLWGKGTPSFEGKALQAADLTCYPRPVQDRIPILVGGSGEKRTLRLAAEYADACNVFGTPERVSHKAGVLRAHCEELGRDIDEIEVTHLTNVVSAPTRPALRDRVELLRGRNVSVEEFGQRNNAGTTEDHIALFNRYAAAGAGHSIVSMPDVHLEGSLESFADVIQGLGLS